LVFVVFFSPSVSLSFLRTSKVLGKAPHQKGSGWVGGGGERGGGGVKGGGEGEVEVEGRGERGEFARVPFLFLSLLLLLPLSGEEEEEEEVVVVVVGSISAAESSTSILAAIWESLFN